MGMGVLCEEARAGSELSCVRVRVLVRLRVFVCVCVCVCVMCDV